MSKIRRIIFVIFESYKKVFKRKKGKNRRFSRFSKKKKSFQTKKSRGDIQESVLVIPQSFFLKFFFFSFKFRLEKFSKVKWEILLKNENLIFCLERILLKSFLIFVIFFSLSLNYPFFALTSKGPVFGIISSRPWGMSI